MEHTLPQNFYFYTWNKLFYHWWLDVAFILGFSSCCFDVLNLLFLSWDLGICMVSVKCLTHIIRLCELLYVFGNYNKCHLLMLKLKTQYRPLYRNFFYFKNPNIKVLLSSSTRSMLLWLDLQMSFNYVGVGLVKCNMDSGRYPWNIKIGKVCGL